MNTYSSNSNKHNINNDKNSNNDNDNKKVSQKCKYDYMFNNEVTEIKNVIYVLELENDKYYIGKAKNNTVDERIAQHFGGIGSEWFKIYKPINIKIIYHNCDDFDEDKYVKIY